LSPVRRARRRTMNTPVIEGGLEWVRGDVRDQRWQFRPAAGPDQVAERPLVGETQVRTLVGEGEPDPDVPGHGTFRIADYQLTAHPQVGEQGILGDRQPQVLAPASCAGEGPAAQYRLEVGRPGQMAPHRPGVQHLDGVDGAPHHVLVEAAADGFDLGEFPGTGQPPAASAPPSAVGGTGGRTRGRAHHPRPDGHRSPGGPGWRPRHPLARHPPARRRLPYRRPLHCRWPSRRSPRHPQPAASEPLSFPAADCFPGGLRPLAAQLPSSTVPIRPVRPAAHADRLTEELLVVGPHSHST